MIIFGQRRDIGRAVFQLQVRVGPAGEVYDLLGGERLQSLDTFQNRRIIVQYMGGQLFQGDDDVMQLVYWFATDGVGPGFSRPEIFFIPAAVSVIFFYIIGNENCKGDKRA